MAIQNNNNKYLLILLGIGIIIAVAFLPNMLRLASRAVPEVSTDLSCQAGEIVNDYLRDANKSEKKYFRKEGFPKVLKITGTVAELYENAKGQKIVLLKDKNAKAGVIATFMNESNSLLEDLVAGDEITLKGVIQTGAYFDTDLEIYEDVVLDKSEIISIK